MNCKGISIGKIGILSVILIIFVMTCVVIHDRLKFHEQVIETANAYIDILKEKHIYLDSVRHINHIQTDCNEEYKVTEYQDTPSITKTNFIISNKFKNNCTDDIALLDVLEKSDGLLSSNGLTFLATLIVALLASLLVYRIDTVEKIIAKNEEFVKETKSYYIHAGKFSHILTRVVNIFSLSTNISNVALALNSSNFKDTNELSLQQIGILCHRLSKTSKQIEIQQNDQIKRIDFLTQEERNLLYSFLEDAIKVLENCQNNSANINDGLISMLENTIYNVNNIMNILENIQAT